MGFPRYLRNLCHLIGWEQRYFSLKFEMQLNNAISKSQGKWKKFEIAGFRNKRGSVKFVTVNTAHYKERRWLNKHTAIKCQKDQQMLLHWKSFECSVVVFFFFSCRFVNDNWLVKPGFHIVESVVSVARKKFIGQIQLYGNLLYNCSIQ